jgi:hypothetical protein
MRARVETAQRLLPGVDADLVRPLQVRLETLFESIRLEPVFDYSRPFFT